MRSVFDRYFISFFTVFTISFQFLNSQNFGEFASAVLLFNCNNSIYYNSTGAGVNCINSDCSVQLNNQNLGSFNTNSQSLILNGGEVKTWKNSNANVCGARINYVVYPQGNRPASPTFSVINIPFKCNCSGTTFADGQGACGGNDQKWSLNNANIDLTARPAGNYTLEIYLDYTGDDNSNNGCPTTRYISNGGFNYVANFQLMNTGSNCSILLPITLGKVELTCKESDINFLWTTLSEQGTSHFIVEGSNNGLDWEYLCEKKAAGYSSLKAEYLCPVPYFDFYRLKQFDNNGDIQFYGPYLNNCEKSDYVIISQQANNLQSFSIITGKDFDGVVHLVDMNGRVVNSWNLSISNGNYSINLPSTTASGIYSVQLFGNSKFLNRKARIVYLPD
ncbi:MAG: T9SS type A sorting domain-containing protein [Bacteroidota bacterium]|jgi:hypothetical protein